LQRHRLWDVECQGLCAETLRLQEEGVFSVVKDVFLPWYNAYRCAAFEFSRDIGSQVIYRRVELLETLRFKEEGVFGVVKECSCYSTNFTGVHWLFEFGD
jgi:hypothetical protein